MKIPQSRLFWWAIICILGIGVQFLIPWVIAKLV